MRKSFLIVFFLVSGLSLQLDFRPGYGVFIKDNVRWHHFDWNVCLSVRYVL